MRKLNENQTRVIFENRVKDLVSTNDTDQGKLSRMEFYRHVTKCVRQDKI